MSCARRIATSSHMRLMLSVALLLNQKIARDASKFLGGSGRLALYQSIISRTCFHSATLRSPESRSPYAAMKMPCGLFESSSIFNVVNLRYIQHPELALIHISMRDYDQVRIGDIERRAILRKVQLDDVLLAGFRAETTYLDGHVLSAPFPAIDIGNRDRK